MNSSGPLYRVEFIDGESRVPFSSTSAILRADLYHPASTTHIVSAASAEVYGNPRALQTVRVGNGGLGPTGLLRELCLAYISSRTELKIEWVVNHSRHSQVALQAGVVNIALTYELEEEERAEREGWCRRIGVLCHDHFVIAGPKSDPAGTKALSSTRSTKSYSNSSSTCTCTCTCISPAATAFKLIAESQSPFHTRGDGSATMHKELELWSAAGLSPQSEDWYQRIECTPLEALRRANDERAYLLTDRATFLTALDANDVPDMDVFVEGGKELLNTCSILVRSDESSEEVSKLSEWLGGSEAQKIIQRYGKDSQVGVPLVSPVGQVEIYPEHEIRTLSLSRGTGTNAERRSPILEGAPCSTSPRDSPLFTLTPALSKVLS